MIEHKVGDIVEDNGVKYLAVKSNGQCDGCCHNVNGECKKDVFVFGWCSMAFRETYYDYIKWEIVK